MESKRQGGAVPLWGAQAGSSPECPVLQVQPWLSQAGQVLGFAEQSLTSGLLQTHLNKHSASRDLISLPSQCCSVLLFGVPCSLWGSARLSCNTELKLWMPWMHPRPPDSSPGHSPSFSSSCALGSSLCSKHESASGLLCSPSLPCSPPTVIPGSQTCSKVIPTPP